MNRDDSFENKQDDKSAKKLNLGCGDDIREGWVNVDIQDGNKIKQYDIEETPWPWKDESVEIILLDNVFEHISPRNRTAVLEECHRILQSNGRLIMRLPVPEVGVGWDETHFSVPSWRWPLHPRWEKHWEVKEIKGSVVGPGRLLPEKLARKLTRFWIARCVDGVSITVEKN